MARIEEGRFRKSPESKNLESRERNTGLHFLIVEDNPENIQGASSYLSRRGDELTKITVDFARDYDEATERLEKGRYNAVITDLFFPKKLGSNDISLGQKIVAEIAKMRQQQDIIAKLEEINVLRNFDNDFPNLKKAVTMEEFHIDRISHMKKDIGQILEADEYEYLMPASEQNQPLGVLIAERAKEQRIPYAIVTSGHGAHGDISTPVAFFMMEKGLITNVYGHRAGTESLDPRDSEYIQNGQFISFEDFKAVQLTSVYAQYYSEKPDRLREAYERTQEQMEARINHPFYTDADKHKPEVWEDIINWMEFILNKSTEKSSQQSPAPQK